MNPTSTETTAFMAAYADDMEQQGHPCGEGPHQALARADRILAANRSISSGVAERVKTVCQPLDMTA